MRRKAGSLIPVAAVRHCLPAGTGGVTCPASEAEEDRLQCDSLNVDGYINKPVNMEKFLSLIRKLKQFWLDDDVILPSVE